MEELLKVLGEHAAGDRDGAGTAAGRGTLAKDQGWAKAKTRGLWRPFR